MHVLLDECVNPRVNEAFPGHTVETVQSMGWSGIKNGKLLALAQQHFDVFVTVDRSGVIVVAVPDNNIRHFRPILAPVGKAAASG
jgi:hypothetical protein